MIRTFVQLHLLCLAAVAAPAVAAPFVNLNFEQATVPPGTQAGNLISISTAFPGWTGRAYGNDLASVYYNPSNLDHAALALRDSNSPFGLPSPEGNFFAILFYDIGSGEHSSLVQTGTIPVGSQSIRLLADDFLGLPPPKLFLNGWEISLSKIAPGPAFFGRYSGDISQYAGQTVQLELRDSGHNLSLDAVSFSIEQVPEPSFLFEVIVLAIVLGNRFRPRS
jgi:hypothetical protein